MPEYNSWAQIAGYFDGDGTISFSDTTNQPYKLSLSLIFVDQSEDQIRNVRDFLRQHGVRSGNILKTSKGTANQVAVSEFHAVKGALESMLPFLCKKWNEARGALDYYEDRITGNDLYSIFKVEVEAGRRERRPRKVPIDVPYLRREGDRLLNERRRLRIRAAIGVTRAKLTLEDYNAIRQEYFKQGKRQADIVREHPQYARETIRRALGCGRGYVLVKGRGRVETTDSR